MITMSHSSIVAWIIAFAVSLGARAAVAQPASANELAEQAGAAFKAGDLANAASMYEQAYTLDPYPMYLFAAGKLRYQLGECVTAVEHLDRFQSAGTGDRVGETKAILDACRGQLDAARQRKTSLADLETSIEEAVTARECRASTTLHARWLELDPADESKQARLGELVARCQPPKAVAVATPIPRRRTPWYRRGGIVAGTAGGALLGLGGSAWLWLGDRSARAANDAADAGGPLADVAAHADAAGERRTTGAWLLGAGVIVVAASQILHRVAPRWQRVEVHAEVGRQSSLGLSLRF